MASTRVEAPVLQLCYFGHLYSTRTQCQRQRERGQSSNHLGDACSEGKAKALRDEVLACVMTPMWVTRPWAQYPFVLITH